MKSNRRVVLLIAVFLTCLLYIAWPRRSLQQILFDDVADRGVDPTNLQSQCDQYFGTIHNSAITKATASRYLLSHQISNHIGHLRVFCKCYLENAFDVPESVNYGELQPIFSGKLPHSSDHNSRMDYGDKKKSFWHNYLTELTGRGIVIGVHDRELDYATRLVRVLGHLQNELPIQFVHEGDLSLHSIDRLERAARRNPNSVQKLEFISVRPSITRGYQAIFKGYNNKWFAALFNTFKEIILMDADAVPFVKPSTFFDLPGYKETGAFFFRDRELSETLGQDQVNFFSSMIPKEDWVFGKKVDPEKLKNNFFNYKAKHVMESGVVVMDRRTHMLGLLISLQLQYWFQSGRVFYGDKDLFWLGQLISGNSDFHFNEHPAGAVGDLEGGNMVCSSQLGHLNKDKKLLWTNGTLLKCKKNTWLSDFFRYSNLRKKYGYSMSKMKKQYASSILISECVLPAPITSLETTPSADTFGFYKDYTRGCSGTQYCATDKNGGEIVFFTPEEKRRYNEIVRIWSA